MVCAGTHHPHRVTCGWIDVVVHRNDHGNEHERVVHQMQLDPGNPDLPNARRHLSTKEVMVRVGLVEEQEMLEVMPELDPERRHPPPV